MTIREIQAFVFEEYCKNGFYDKFDCDDTEISDIAELGLITTEVAEAIEVVRRGVDCDADSGHLAEECADIIIRTLNFMSRWNLDAESAIVKKNAKNGEREKLHGKRI